MDRTKLFLTLQTPRYGRPLPNIQVAITRLVKELFLCTSSSVFLHSFNKGRHGRIIAQFIFLEPVTVVFYLRVAVIFAKTCFVDFRTLIYMLVVSQFCWEKELPFSPGIVIRIKARSVSG